MAIFCSEELVAILQSLTGRIGMTHSLEGACSRWSGNIQNIIEVVVTWKKTCLATERGSLWRGTFDRVDEGTHPFYYGFLLQIKHDGLLSFK